MRVLVCGGRDYADWHELSSHLARLRLEAPHDTLTIIQGGAKGADGMAREWCEAYHVAYINYPADWERHGRAAGPIRNQRMLDDGRPELVLAFPGGRGTADMIGRALKAGVRVVQIGALTSHKSTGSPNAD